MGFISKILPNSKKSKDVSNTINTTYDSTPVPELEVENIPVGFTPTSMDVLENSPMIKFDDESINHNLSNEQKQLVDNGYYLSQPSVEQVNPTVNLFNVAQQVEQSNEAAVDVNSYDNSYVDDELPDNDMDKGIFASHVDGTYSSVNSNTYEEEVRSEGKFFPEQFSNSNGYEDYLNQKKADNPPVYASYDIFNISKVDDDNNSKGMVA